MSGDPNPSRIDLRISRRPGHAYRQYAINWRAWEKTITLQKSAARGGTEFPFRFFKVIYRFRKTLYRGIVKPFDRLQVLFAGRACMPEHVPGTV